MWHCPHCGAPQAETARCWVCRRSSTTCSTCRHFGASLATDVGFCALDRNRRPLTGRELRGCWTAPPTGSVARAAGDEPRWEPDLPVVGHGPGRTFIPVEGIRARVPRAGDSGSEASDLGLADAETTSDASAAADARDVPFLPSDPLDAWETRTSLFGEPER